MSTLPASLLVGAATTVAVGALDGQGWPSYVIGAVLALSLWTMLFFGSFVTGTKGEVPWRGYAGCAVAAVVVGLVVVWMTNQSAFWAVGFIIAGVLWPTGSAATRDRAAG